MFPILMLLLIRREVIGHKFIENCMNYLSLKVCLDKNINMFYDQGVVRKLYNYRGVM